MSKDVVIYGAGAIGRGFLAPIMDKGGYDVYFVDKNEELIKKLKERKHYMTAFTHKENYELQSVNIKGVFNVNEADDIISKVKFVFVSVGPKNVREVSEKLKKAKTIYSFENERDSAQTIKNISKVKRTFFGIPDVIASSTASPELLKLDELCVVSEIGDLVVEKSFFNGLPKTIKQVNKKDLDECWACKFYLHNTSHAITAYLGAEKGYKYIHEAMADEEINDTVTRAMEGIRDTIISKGLVPRIKADWYAYRELNRFRNKLLYDPILRVAREPLRKLRPGDRLISVAKMMMSEGVDPKFVIKGIKAAINYDDVMLNNLKKTFGIEGIVMYTCGLRPTTELYQKIMEEFK